MAVEGGRRIALDTSVIVAALLQIHEHHSVAAPFVASLRASGGLILPLPSLIESYSVLTRLPLPRRLDRTAVQEALARTFRGHAVMAALDGNSAWPFLEGAVAQSIVGGAVCDLHIATCAHGAGATHLATFNLRHFERFDFGGMNVFAPG